MPKWMRLVAGGLSVAMVSMSAHAFGVRGHRLVGDIAQLLLLPAVREQVDELLQSRSLADVANWADEVRSQQPETGPWHYVNVKAGAAHFDLARDCPGECVVERIGHFRAILGDREQPAPERRIALMWLVHLVGDLHQPLHVSLAEDRGGNSIEVKGDQQELNLHWVWDSLLIDRRGLTLSQHIQRLAQHTTRAQVQAFRAGTVADWADESWQLAMRVGYRDLDGRFIASGDTLSDAWLQARGDVVDEQLVKAGVRLAMLLNQTLQ